MIATFAFVLSLVVPQAAAPVALPDTPQGKHVAAYVAAFNSGNEQTFVEVHDKLFSKTMLDRIAVERRKEMFKRMQGDFGTFKIEKVVKATAQQIVIQVPTKDGAEGTFTFDFEDTAPYRISNIGVDVKGN